MSPSFRLPSQPYDDLPEPGRVVPLRAARNDVEIIERVLDGHARAQPGARIAVMRAEVEHVISGQEPDAPLSVLGHGVRVIGELLSDEAPGDLRAGADRVLEIEDGSGCVLRRVWEQEAVPVRAAARERRAREVVTGGEIDIETEL